MFLPLITREWNSPSPLRAVLRSTSNGWVFQWTQSRWQLAPCWVGAAERSRMETSEAAPPDGVRSTWLRCAGETWRPNPAQPQPAFPSLFIHLLPPLPAAALLISLGPHAQLRTSVTCHTSKSLPSMKKIQRNEDFFSQKFSISVPLDTECPCTRISTNDLHKIHL